MKLLSDSLKEVRRNPVAFVCIFGGIVPFWLLIRLPRRVSLWLLDCEPVWKVMEYVYLDGEVHVHDVLGKLPRYLAWAAGIVSGIVFLIYCPEPVRTIICAVTLLPHAFWFWWLTIRPYIEWEASTNQPWNQATEPIDENHPRLYC